MTWNLTVLKPVILIYFFYLIGFFFYLLDFGLRFMKNMVTPSKQLVFLLYCFLFFKYSKKFRNETFSLSYDSNFL